MISRYKPEAVQIMTSAICNLNCVYCYIPKCSSLKDIHKIIQSNMTFDKITASIDEVVDRLTTISLWGGEPTIGLAKFNTILPQLLQYYTHLSTISTSTNLYNIQSLVDMIKIMATYANKDRQMLVELQVSIDGPDDVVRANRGIGADVLCSNLELLCSMLADITNEYMVVKLHNKPTGTIEYYKECVDSPSKITEYMDFFAAIVQKCERVVGKNSNVKYQGLFVVPTLACPGNYDSKDGRTYADFGRLQIDNRDAYIKKYNIDVVSTNQCYRRIVNTHYISHSIDSKMHLSNLLCSAGRSCIGAGASNTHPLCHEAAFWEYEEYAQEAQALTFNTSCIECYRADGISDRDIDVYLEHMVPASDGFETARNQYVQHSIRVNIHRGITNAYALVKVMAKSGHANKRFVTDKSAAITFATYLTLNSCWLSAYRLTGEYTVIPSSTINILGNGHFCMMLDAFRKDLRDHNTRPKIGR